MLYLIRRTRFEGQPLYYILHPYQNGQDFDATNDEGQSFLQSCFSQRGNSALSEDGFQEIRERIFLVRASNIEECWTVLQESLLAPTLPIHLPHGNCGVLDYDREAALNGLRPRIGIITDTHDDRDRTLAAIELLNEQHCAAVIHCGDFIFPSTVELFAGLSPGIKLFWINGPSHDNLNGNFAALCEASNRIGAVCLTGDGIGLGLLFVHFRGKRIRIGVCHDTYQKDDVIGLDGNHTVVWSWSGSHSLDYLLYGHLHYWNIKFPSEQSPTVVFNSGGFYKGPLKSFAVLDFSLRELDLFYMGEGAQYFSKGLCVRLSNGTIDYDLQEGAELKDLMQQARAANPGYWRYRHTRDTEAWPLYSP